MPRKRQGVTFNGPYPHRAKWRVLRRATGAPDQWISCETEEEGRRLIADAKRAIEGRRVSEAIDAYVARLATRCADETLAFTRNRLRAAAPNPDEVLAAITPARAKALLAKVEGSVATRRETLKAARRWWRWLVAEGWTRGAPWDGLAVEGTRGKGKPQLGEDEARALLDHCLANPTPANISVATALLMALRRNEITGLIGRDVDRGGQVLVIRGTKTKNAKRRAEVPDVLVPHLRALAEQSGALGLLFGVVSKDWLRIRVRIACRAAGVPVVCPHGLRGTWSTIATNAGAAAHLVAAQLGHGHKTAIAERHYIRPEATQAAATERVLSVIAGGRSG